MPSILCAQNSRLARLLTTKIAEQVLKEDSQFRIVSENNLEIASRLVEAEGVLIIDKKEFAKISYNLVFKRIVGYGYEIQENGNAMKRTYEEDVEIAKADSKKAYLGKFISEGHEENFYWYLTLVE